MKIGTDTGTTSSGSHATDSFASRHTEANRLINTSAGACRTAKNVTFWRKLSSGPVHRDDRLCQPKTKQNDPLVGWCNESPNRSNTLRSELQTPRSRVQCTASVAEDERRRSSPGQNFLEPSPAVLVEIDWR